MESVSGANFILLWGSSSSLVIPLLEDFLVMEPTIFALGLACSQVLMLTLIIAKSIYSQIKEVRMVEKEKYAKSYSRILHRQMTSNAQRNPARIRRR